MQSVQPDSLVAKQGIRVGDVLETMDGQPVEGVESIKAVVKNASETDAKTIKIVLRRGSETVELKTPIPEEGMIGVRLQTRNVEPVFE